MTHHQLLPDPMTGQDHHPMDVSESEGIGFALGMGLGILVGVCAGLLIAPKPGKEMISTIEDKVSDLKARAMEHKDLAAEKWEAAKERIMEAVSSGKTRAAELLGQNGQSEAQPESTSESQPASTEQDMHSETLSGNPNLQM